MGRSRKTAVEGRLTVRTPPRRRRRRSGYDKNSSKRQHHQEPYRNLRWREDMDWDRYKREMEAYEGYYLTKAAGVGGTAPSRPDSEYVIAAAKYAVKVYNKKKRPEVALKLNKVVRSNVCGGSTQVHSLTLATSDGRFYETEVVMRRGGVGVKVKVFRPAIHYPVRKPINMPSKQMYKNNKRQFI